MVTKQLNFVKIYYNLKGEYDLALKLAKYAVDTTPSEYLTWAKLTEGNLYYAISFIYSNT